ncbi:MAG TPA: alpha/beta hydrolase [Actinomycetota bacterium]
MTHVLGWLVTESPVLPFGLLVASTAWAIGQSGIDSPLFWIGFGVAVPTSVGLVIIALRAARTGPAIDRALNEGLGPGWRSLEPALADRLLRRPSLARTLYAPFRFRHPDVERVANIRYGGAGRANRLDLYRHRHQPSEGPTLVHLHGGAFVFGRKSREARPLFYRLARHGWTCVSANYRVRRAGRFPNPLIDVKKALAWVREHGPEHGANREVVLVAGSSAGANLAALAALTADDPAFQPGFERVDTSVSGAICMYGYYGAIDGGGRVPSSPSAYVGDRSPPFLIAHGDQDALVLVEDVRRFVDELRTASRSPVVYAELPGAQHGFDYFDSVRFELVIDAIEAFAAWVRSASRSPGPDGRFA